MIEINIDSPSMRSERDECIERALTNNGWMLRDELFWLYEQARRMKSILEIGSWEGRSTSVLCAGCNGFVVAIDHFLGSPEHQDRIKAGENPYANFVINMSQFKNLITLKTRSDIASAILCVPQSFDMVFIDGAHEYEDVVSDLELWGDRAQIILCGHDGNYKSIQRALAKRFPGREPGKVQGTTLWFYEIEGVA